MSNTSNNIILHRSIADDSVLAEAIAAELKLRNVEPGPSDHVALISEWDTIYGRTFAPTMVHAFDQNCVDEKHKVRSECGWVHILKYERGLDGAVPPRDRRDQSNADKDISPDTDVAKAADKERAKAKADEQAFDRPYGQGSRITCGGSPRA